ncbi:MAG: sugar kinase [Planctomycetota bacterium]
MPSIELVVIGNTCIDLYVPPHDAPPTGGISLIPPLDVQLGGNGANTAVMAARLGVRTALPAVLGDDLFGRHVKEQLEREGVLVDLLTLEPGQHSPITLVQNDADGERSFVHHPGTNSTCRLPDVVRDLSGAHLHLAAPELLPGIWPGAAIEIAESYRARGSSVSLDTFAAGDEDLSEEHRPLLERVDTIVPNEDEARRISGRDDLEDVLAYFHDCGVKEVIITRGEQGALLSIEGNAETIPATAVNAIDTCGAGDNFAAGFVTAKIRGFSSYDAARIGCSMGTLCVTERGALSAGSSTEARFQAIPADLRERWREANET